LDVINNNSFLYFAEDETK